MIGRYLLLILVFVAGCQVSPPPDPNDPRDVGMVDAQVLQRNLSSASNNLNIRQQRGELSADEARELMRQYADQLVAHIDIEKVPPHEAWRYAEVFRTARQWDEARQLLEVAIEQARTEDRRVNDTLRLAEANVHLGNVQRAIELARTTFTAPAEDKAPILPAVLFEIGPPAEGKGHDVELAQLVTEAAEQHRQVVVDPESEAGQMFLMARPHHVRNAYRKAAELYRAANREDMAQKALQRLRELEREQIRV
jgi:tetratricopeptide (TPR) repeat protein